MSFYCQHLKPCYKLTIKAKTYYIRNILHMNACYSSFIFRMTSENRKIEPKHHRSSAKRQEKSSSKACSQMPFSPIMILSYKSIWGTTARQRMFDWINSCLKNREHLESRSLHMRSKGSKQPQDPLVKKNFFLNHSFFCEFLKGKERKLETK